MKTTFGSFLMMITMMNSVFAQKWKPKWTNENKICNPEEKMADWNNLLEKTSFDLCAQSCYDAVGCTFAAWNNKNTHCTGFNSCSTTEENTQNRFTVMEMNYPVDCVGSWGEYGECTATCGDGTQTKTYTVETQAANGGAACPEVQTETQTCNLGECPIDCVGSWGEYGECTATCGGGTQTKTYTVQTQAENGGAACPDVQTQTQACNTDACPIDCVGSWGEYGNCTFTADGGECTQTKTYMVQTEAANGGVACPAVQTESQACSNTDKCKWTVEWTNENKICNPAEKMADWNNLGEKSSFDQCAQSCYVAVGCTFASFNNDNTHCTGFNGSCSETKEDRKFSITVMKMIYPKVGQNVEMNPEDVQRSLELEF